MARFLATALRNLSAGYQLVGSQVSTDTLDLGGVQLTQDVSQVLAHGRGPAKGGWFELVIRQDVDENETNEERFSFLDPFAPASTGAGGRQIEVSDEFDLWLYSVWATSYNSAGIITVNTAAASIEVPSGILEGSNIAFTNNSITRRILAYWDTTVRIETTTGGVHQRALWNVETTEPRRFGPIFIPHPNNVESARIRFYTSVTTGAGVTGNVNLGARFRAVPRGFPPGP